MKKTLIASAVAAATFSGSALAMETASDLAARMDSMPNVYGNIQYAVTHDNFDDGPSAVDHRDNGSTLGVTHEHEIAPGITGFFKAEMEFDADDKSASTGLSSLDEAYIGVKGDGFGKVWLGSDDSTYESAIDYIANFYEAADLSIGGKYDTGEGDLLQYETPSFGGLTLGAAVQVNGDADGGDKSYPYQLAALYEVDGVELAVAMDSNDNSDPNSNNENTYGVRAGYSLDNLSVSAEFQTRKDVADLYGVIGVYTMGPNQFALSYEYAEADNGADLERDTITLQALHNVSDHMYVYFEGYLGGGDDVYGFDPVDSNGDGEKDSFASFTDERSIAAVGAVYYF